MNRGVMVEVCPPPEPFAANIAPMWFFRRVQLLVPMERALGFDLLAADIAVVDIVPIGMPRQMAMQAGLAGERVGAALDRTSVRSMPEVFVSMPFLILPADHHSAYFANLGEY